MEYFCDINKESNLAYVLCVGSVYRTLVIWHLYQAAIFIFMHFVVFIQIWISHVLNYLRNMFALLSSLYVSSDSIIMSQIQICVTANQKWMLTRDIFLPYVLCTFFFIHGFHIKFWGFGGMVFFFFQISSLINLISMYFYTYLVKYSPYFVLSSTYFIFFLFYPAFFVR